MKGRLASTMKTTDTYSSGPENRANEASDLEKPPVDMVVRAWTTASSQVIPKMR